MSLALLIQELSPFQLYLINILLAATGISCLAIFLGGGNRFLPLQLRTVLYQAILIGLLAIPVMPLLATVTGVGLLAPVVAPGPVETPGNEVVSVQAGTSQNNPRTATPTVIATTFDRESHEATGTVGATGSGLKKVVWLFIGIWFGGVLVGLLNLVRAYRRLARIVKNARAAGPGMARFLPRRTPLGAASNPPRLLLSSAVGSPFSYGVARPTIILPDRALADNLVQASLLHEHGHIALGHHRQSQPLLLLGILFWWHPLLRKVIQHIRDNQEECCDAYVLARGLPPGSYAGALAEIARLAGGQTRLTPTVGIFSGRITLEQRIRNLITRQKDLAMNRYTQRSITVSFAILLGALTLTFTIVPAQGAGDVGPTGMNETKAKTNLTGQNAKTTRTYDFHFLLSKAEKKGAKSPIQPLAGAGKHQPQAQSETPHGRFIKTLRSALALGRETGIRPGEDNTIIVHATPASHQAIEEFRRENLVAVLDDRFFRISVKYYQFGREDAGDKAGLLLRGLGIKPAARLFMQPITSGQADAFLATFPPEYRKANMHTRSVDLVTFGQGTLDHFTVISYIMDFKVKIKDAVPLEDPVFGLVKDGIQFSFQPVMVSRNRFTPLFKVTRMEVQKPIPNFEIKKKGRRKPLTIQLPESKIRTLDYRYIMDKQIPGGFFMIPWQDQSVLVGVVTVNRIANKAGKKGK